MTSEDTRLTDNSSGHPHLILAWMVVAVGCVTGMLLKPGHESIPYHLGWAGFALAFGFGRWSRWELITSLALYTLATGVILERSWLRGDVSWDDSLTEIPLMLLLALLMVWQVRRSRTARAEVTRLAEREVQASRDRERLMRLTSHELRTPLTICRGYIEILQARTKALDDRDDLSVVADELDRLSRVSDRLIRMMQLQDDWTREIVDIDQVLAQALERWRVVADRRWVLDARAGRTLGSAERLRTCLDTLVENAIRYTCVGSTIRLGGSREHQQVVVSVIDDGVGMTDQQMIAINAGEQPQTAAATAGTVAGTDAATVDPLAGTGLGLCIVRQSVHALGGTLQASQAPDGGAALSISYPLKRPCVVAPLFPRIAPGVSAGVLAPWGADPPIRRS